MSLALQIAKMKRHGCRYCENLVDVVPGKTGEYGMHCKFKETSETCGKWTVAKCMLPDQVTRVFPADVWEQVTDAIDSLLQLDVAHDARVISPKQFELLERWFVCETPPES